ncbi:MAG: SGNH/GDSL hydrolase family protein, partial [Verrucomicrobiae bacterium]|nr:SGNH/GDSL hydrolase family protein [Verrucomicrobiae bacterium]
MNLFPFRVLPLSLALGILWSSVPSGAQTPDDYPRREAVECRTRGGIPHVLAKLQKGDGAEIRVAYLGGSITAAPGWRVKSLTWLQERFPKQKLVEINAAIGGTGSDLGVFRNEQDVLRHQPDLLFVEFAVNDGGASPERIHQAMEGIVRQTWTANPETDIIFVYTLSQPFLADLQAGKFSRSASAMEELADHYGIPSIHFGLEVAAREKTGTLIFKGEKPAEGAEAKPDPRAPMVFSTDGVHPLVETGHQLYLEAIARSWEKLEAVSDEKELVSAGHALNAPLRPDHWAAAKLVPLSDAMRSGGWEKLDGSESGDSMAKRFARQMPEMWKATEPGATLKFRFKGTVAGIYDLVGPDGGQLKIR